MTFSGLLSPAGDLPSPPFAGVPGLIIGVLTRDTGADVGGAGVSRVSLTVGKGLCATGVSSWGSISMSAESQGRFGSEAKLGWSSGLGLVVLPEVWSRSGAGVGGCTGFSAGIGVAGEGGRETANEGEVSGPVAIVW